MWALRATSDSTKGANAWASLVLMMSTSTFGLCKAASPLMCTFASHGELGTSGHLGPPSRMPSCRFAEMSAAMAAHDAAMPPPGLEDDSATQWYDICMTNANAILENLSLPQDADDVANFMFTHGIGLFRDSMQWSEMFACYHLTVRTLEWHGYGHLIPLIRHYMSWMVLGSTGIEPTAFKYIVMKHGGRTLHSQLLKSMQHVLMAAGLEQAVTATSIAHHYEDNLASAVTCSAFELEPRPVW